LYTNVKPKIHTHEKIINKKRPIINKIEITTKEEAKSVIKICQNNFKNKSVNERIFTSMERSEHPKRKRD